MANIPLSSLITPINITGNAGTATALETPRTIAISGAVTGTATSFSGASNITIPITALDVGAATTGILAVARGGTGIGSYTVGNYIYASGTGTLAERTPAQVRTDIGAGTGNGTVTSVSVTTANGVSGSVATSTTTPAITLTLGAITPTTVVASGAISAVGIITAKGASAGLSMENRANSAQTSVWYRNGADVILNYSGIGDIATISSAGNTTLNGWLITGGSISCSAGDITSPQNFISAGTTSILATTGSGTVYLRPSGAGSSTGQVTVSSAGVVTINNQIITQGTVRSQAETTSLSGQGIEMYYAANVGYLVSFDRSGSIWKTLRLYGLTTDLYASNTLIQTTTTSGIAVTGAITATGNTTAYSSDRRLKSNLRVIESAASKLSLLNGYVYDWNKEVCKAVGFKPDHDTEHGLIAQEVREVIFDATAPAPFNNDYLTVRYERVVPLIVAATNENTRKIEALENEVHELKQKLKENL